MGATQRLQVLFLGSPPARPLSSVRFSFFAQKRLCFPLFLLQMSKLSRPTARLPVWCCYCLFFACLAFFLLYALCRPSVLPIYAPAVRSCFPSVRPSVFRRFALICAVFVVFCENFFRALAGLCCRFEKNFTKKCKFFY